MIWSAIVAAQCAIIDAKNERRWNEQYSRADEPTRKVLLMEKAHRLTMREIAKESEAQERRIAAYMAALNSRARYGHSDSSSDDALALLIPLGLIGLGVACAF